MPGRNPLRSPPRSPRDESGLVVELPDGKLFKLSNPEGRVVEMPNGSVVEMLDGQVVEMSNWQRLKMVDGSLVEIRPATIELGAGEIAGHRIVESKASDSAFRDTWGATKKELFERWVASDPVVAAHPTHVPAAAATPNTQESTASMQDQDRCTVVIMLFHNGLQEVAVEGISEEGPSGQMRLYRDRGQILARSGLIEKGDVLRTIDGKNVHKQPFDQIHPLLLGAPGSTVELGFARGFKRMGISLDRPVNVRLQGSQVFWQAHLRSSRLIFGPPPVADSSGPVGTPLRSCSASRKQVGFASEPAVVTFNPEPGNSVESDPIVAASPPDVRVTAVAEEDKQKLLHEVLRDCDGHEFLFGRLFFVGDGRAGKTAMSRSMEGREFEETDSTVGVSQALLEVRKTELEAVGDWRVYDARRRELEQAVAHILSRKLKQEELASDKEDALASDHEEGSVDGGIMGWISNEDAGKRNQQGEENDEVDDGMVDGVVEGQVGSQAEASAAKAMTALTSEEDQVVAGTSEQTAQPTVISVAKTGGSESAESKGEKSLEEGEAAVGGQEERGNEEVLMSRLDWDLVVECQAMHRAPLKLSMWDFGGQPAFLLLHHLFLSRYGVYLLVFNMKWLCPSADAAKREECLTTLKFWITSISVHTMNSASSSQAPVLLIGTHKDQCSDVADHQSISDVLYNHLSGTVGWASIEPFHNGTVPSGRGRLWFYPVDNTIGKADPVLREVKMTVEKVMSEEEYIRQKVPLQWIAVFDTLRADGRTAISMQELQDLARRRNLPTGSKWTLKEEVTLLATFLSGLGFIMYHPEPALRDVVIINPVDFLIIPASKVVCDHRIHHLPEHERARRRYPQQWNLMMKGILHQQVLEILIDDVKHQAALETMLCKFGVIVPLVPEGPDEPQLGADEDAAVRYLVPALLPEVSPHQATVDEAVARERKLSCFLVFGTESVMGSWQKRGSTSMEAVAREGFYPGGLFPRLLAKCAHWMQMTTGCEVEDMELCRERGIFCFGTHKLMLTNQQHAGHVRIDIFVSHPVVVVETVLEQARQVLREVIRGLHCCLVVPSDGGARPEGYAGYLGPVMVLHGKRGVIEVEGRGDRMLVGHNQVLEAPELRQRFGPFLPPRGLLPHYDVFLSYRWSESDTGLDSSIALGVFTLLSQDIIHGRALQAFLDKKRLQVGRNFQRDFALALSTSRVMVPIVSHAALAKMHTLQADSEDNVLLEWLLGLELLEQKQLDLCIPVMLGKETGTPADNGAMVTNLFREPGNPSELPDLVPRRVVDLASSILAGLQPHSKGASAAAFAKMTVRSVVQNITARLGVPGWDVSKSHGGGVASSVEHDKDAFKSRLIRYTARQIMKCLRELPPLAPANAANPAQGPVSPESPVVTHHNAKGLEEWTVEEVCGLLRCIGKGTEAATFAEEYSIDGEDLKGYLASGWEHDENPLYMLRERGGMGLMQVQVLQLRKELRKRGVQLP